MFCNSKLSHDQYFEEDVYIDNLKMIQIMPTLKCNARCKHCHIWGENGWALNEKDINKDLDAEGIKKLLLDAKEYNKDRNFWVMLTGGEILLYNQIEELLLFIKENNLPVLLLTNGLLLSKYLDLIFRTVNVLNLSLDGNPQVHNSIRGINNLFEKVYEGITELILLKKKNNSITPIITLNYAISRHNISHIPDFIECMKDVFSNKGINLRYEPGHIVGVNDILIQFEPLLYTTVERGLVYSNVMKSKFGIEISNSWKGFITDRSLINTIDAQQYLTSLWKENNVNHVDFVNLDTYFHNIDEVFGRLRCLKPWNGIMIREDGGVYFCPDLKDYCIGNIKTNSFMEIWKGNKAEEFRSHLKNSLLPVCNRCCGLFIDYDASIIPIRNKYN